MGHSLFIFVYFPVFPTDEVIRAYFHVLLCYSAVRLPGTDENLSLFPVLQCLYHAQVAPLVEDGVPGDYIVQVRIQLQCLLVPLGDIKRDPGIVMLTCQLLRCLQQARANSLPTPIFEYSERVNIPFIVLRLAFEPASNGSIQPYLVSSPKAQNQSDHLRAMFSELDVLIAETIAFLPEEVPQTLAPPALVFCAQRIGDLCMYVC